MMRRGLMLAAAMFALGAALAADAQACGPKGKGRQHHAMMQTAMPRGGSPAMLPQPQSPGAQLVGAYCTQCHGVPSPGLHAPEEWEGVASRMYRRMLSFAPRVHAPSGDEFAAIVAYLEEHSAGSGHAH